MYDFKFQSVGGFQRNCTTEIIHVTKQKFIILKFADTYKSVQKAQRTSARSAIRHTALNNISRLFLKLNESRKLVETKRIQFLYIHHIFQDEEVPLQQLIEKLSKNHHFISYSDAVRKMEAGVIDKPYLCISSDDGFKNNLRAAEILRAYGISACFFICPAIIGEEDPDKISEFCRTRLNFPAVEFLNWVDVEKLQKLGHEIGGHTMNHVNIASTTPEHLPFEIGECYRQLQHHCGTSPHFAFPYGRFFHFNDIGKQEVFQAGFHTISSAERGCHISDSNQRINTRELMIRRDHIVLTWPWQHIEYFIAKNAKNASINSNYFPSYAGSDHNR